jgi:hypothetical protein
LCVSKNKWSHHTRGLLSELSFWKQLPLLNAERKGEKEEGIQALMNGGRRVRGRREWIKRRKGGQNRRAVKSHIV